MSCLVALRSYKLNVFLVNILSIETKKIVLYSVTRTQFQLFIFNTRNFIVYHLHPNCGCHMARMFRSKVGILFLRLRGPVSRGSFGQESRIHILVPDVVSSPAGLAQGFLKDNNASSENII